MAGLKRTCALATTLARLSRLQLSTTPALTQVLKPCLTSASNYFNCRAVKSVAGFHTSASLQDLREFFDDEKNWGEQEVKVGRAWKRDELRIKSNEDLHKLWFVLLKERNMLFTMEHSAKEEHRLLPNPERIDKVEESMMNLEQVVVERNRAYWMLETGETGERPSGVTTNILGIRKRRQFTEHFVPIWMHHRSSEKIHPGAAVVKFQRLIREKCFVEKRKYYRRVRGHVYMLWRKFPGMNEEALQRQYPEVNVKQLKSHKKARGHHVHNKA